MDVLVKRAREVAHKQEHINAICKTNMGAQVPDGHDEDVLNVLNDCADALEARDARIADLEGRAKVDAGLITKTATDAADWKDRAEAAEARVKVLEDALTRIAAPCAVSATVDWRVMYEAWRALCVERVDIARAALEGEKR